MMLCEENMITTKARNALSTPQNTKQAHQQKQKIM
jgi:hypothetical protein